MGDTNIAIIAYNQDVTFSYYDTVSSIINSHINLSSETDSTIKAEMDPSNLGVDDETALFNKFDLLKNM